MKKFRLHNYQEMNLSQALVDGIKKLKLFNSNLENWLKVLNQRAGVKLLNSLMIRNIYCVEILQDTYIALILNKILK